VSDLDNSLPWLDALKWDADGMIPAIAQDGSGRVVMFAFMNRESLQETVRCGNAVYWSRSRQRLWRKGEESGHFQKVKSIRTDCDGDVLLLRLNRSAASPVIPAAQAVFSTNCKGNAGFPPIRF
jgi:phosphoribosyl-AMP cyclohydrolase